MAAEVVANQRQGHLICATCKRRHCDETGELPGSVGPAPVPFKHVGILNIETRVCIVPQVTEFSWLMVRMHGHYRRGHLWEPMSGPQDQPNIYIRAMELLDAMLPENSG